MTRILLLGGGHAHAQVLLALRNFISKNLEVVLVSETALHSYSGMVPGVIAGHYAEADAQIDLGRLARGAAVQFVAGRVIRLDTDAKLAELENGATLDYDIVSLNLGSLPLGLRADAVSVKPFQHFIARWRRLIEAPEPPRIAVVGAGAGGVEIAMAMKHALAQRPGGAVELFSDRLELQANISSRVRKALDRLAVPLHLGKAAGPGFDATFWITGAAALPLLRESGLKTDSQGYVLVDACLRSVSHPNVFAAGDNASLEGQSLPKSGVYAVRQGPVLSENLKRVVRGMPMLDYRPQAASLSLLSCGAKYAIASRGAWSAEGRWAWWWKDWIDRRWMARFR